MKSRDCEKKFGRCAGIVVPEIAEIVRAVLPRGVNVDPEDQDAGARRAKGISVLAAARATKRDLHAVKGAIVRHRATVSALARVKDSDRDRATVVQDVRPAKVTEAPKAAAARPPVNVVPETADRANARSVPRKTNRLSRKLMASDLAIDHPTIFLGPVSSETGLFVG